MHPRKTTITVATVLALAGLALAGCDYTDSGYLIYGETSEHHGQRIECERDNEVSVKVANDLAYQHRYQEADIYVRTHPIRDCPKPP